MILRAKWYICYILLMTWQVAPNQLESLFQCEDLRDSGKGVDIFWNIMDNTTCSEPHHRRRGVPVVYVSRPQLPIVVLAPAKDVSGSQ